MIKYFLIASLCLLSTTYSVDFMAEAATFTELGNSNAKPEILILLSEVASKGEVLRTGKDADIRPAFVGAQAEMEKVLSYLLSKGEIKDLKAYIHTPMPATPLCTQGDILPGLVDASLLSDEKRLYTVKERAVIVREYLDKGGVLYIAYPKGGREKRTAAQLEIYDTERNKYPKTLNEIVLNCTEMQPDMIGATYLFKTKEGDSMAFAIKSSQAISPNDDQIWGLWFGKMTQPLVNKRINAVLEYININSFSF